MGDAKMYENKKKQIAGFHPLGAGVTVRQLQRSGGINIYWIFHCI
jgi:hypothetical protein